MSLPSPSDSPDRGEGLMVGEYELLAHIGEGGMGIVHLARKPGGDRVALKMLRPHVVGDDEARARLAREIGSLRRIRSRWVAEILDADPWAEIPFVATRYVPGLSLHDHVPEEGPIAGHDLLWFAGALAEGLASVHEAGVLHRDIKPSNVLMEGRTPILIDFGLARVADDPKLTQTGWLLGTPGYLAPEILYGDEATPASDVHAWGATVAFAATGDPPFGGGPSMAIMDRVRRGEHHLDGLAGPLREVVIGALRPEPERRPDLEEILAWLRPQTTRPSPTLAAPPAGTDERPSAGEDLVTLPLALAAQTHEDPETLRLGENLLGAPVPPPSAPPPATVPLRPPAPAPGAGPVPWDPYASLDPAPTRAGPVERLRRALLLLCVAGIVAAGIAAAPWVTGGVIVVLVWLLRSGSLAASAAGDRRRVRGIKWYDGPRLLLGAPWDLVRSLPGAGVLLLWSGGLALAAALICYAAALGAESTLLASGGVLALGMWWGPGGIRLRSPVLRVVHPLARTWRRWAVAIVVLVVLLAGGVGVISTQGVPSGPAERAPFLVPR